MTLDEDARLGSMRELSLLIERETAYDSIPTIERVYDHEGGTYGCVWPGCKVRRKDSEALWRHVHMSPKHRTGGLGAYAAEMADLGGTEGPR